MTPNAVYLKAPQYVLGEIEEAHTAIENLSSRARELRIPLKAGLWGWGRIRRTEKTLEEMAIASGSRTLRSAGIAPSSIDLLILCSTRFPSEVDLHGRMMETVMTGMGLADAAFMGITLNRCTNLLSAVHVADAFVRSGRYRNVLVVTTDRIADESVRMEKFALFSDGAASCVVAAEHSDEAYEVLACATAQTPSELDGANEISADLSRLVNDRLLGPLGLTLEDVSGLMHANLFKPLVAMKERLAGFTPAQIYTENIERIGHCFAADPLINLVDRAAAGHVRGGGHYMLASSVAGSRLGVLLRKVTENGKDGRLS
ncbi:3-oxoacyl-ACP synthase [Streptomyces sp. NPDC053048]|uniref:3-oxoacyl-ACP synthase n=1 Tax=Streptomyces sp. NPDC053048 TaxID=3365694 RepID=UPI0037D01E6F